MARTSATQEKLRSIKAIALDVDGVLTDGGMWWGADGSELKRFSFADIMGISLARRSGLTIALISGEDSPLVDRYAAKLLIADVVKGCRDKASALRDFAQRNNLELSEICFMGDDVNDLPAMDISGLSAAPADARPVVIERVGFVAGAAGGCGAVREVVEALLAARGMDAETVFRNSL
jgi:3-deoxy-D-manno-octulosonate 8-phosphate phosphatase (KDO 8-P phosphatase)